MSKHTLFLLSQQVQSVLVWVKEGETELMLERQQVNQISLTVTKMQFFFTICLD
jgi:hypothetical protein